MSAFSRLLFRVSSGRVALGAVLLYAVFAATVLPWQARQAEDYSNGVASPDSSFFYTASDMYAAAAAFGADGRHDYVIARVTFDVIWPLVYAIVISTVLSWALARVVEAGSRLRLLNLLPWLALVLDFGENFCAALVFGRYPSETPVIAHVATFFTMAKWLVLAAAFVVLAVALVAAGVNRFRAPRRKAA